MSLFNLKQESSYSKLDVEAGPPAYSSKDANKYDMPMIPESSHSRFTAPVYHITDEEFNNHDHQKERHIAQDEPKRETCRWIANISFIIGSMLLLLSIVFKIVSRTYISQAITFGCPAHCITTCYQDLPLDSPLDLCNSLEKQACDDTCLSVGIQEATTYTILFFVLVTMGGVMIAFQIVNSCLGYFCWDYRKHQRNQIIPTK